MLVCDHFIYTSAKTELKEGYQVIARSAGITDEIISDLHSYLYPIGLDPQEFNESRSLLILNEDKIAYSIIKNIGAGYDTRKGTLYNHTFVLSKLDFERMDNDSRLFDKLFIIDPSHKRELQKVRFNPARIQIDFKPLKILSPSSLQQLLYSFFTGGKVALLIDGGHPTLIQNFLVCLPPSVRTVSFSTLVNEPERQHNYEFIQIPKFLDYKLIEEWKRVVVSSSSLDEQETHATSKSEEFRYVANLILNEDKIRLKELHEAFEHIPGKENLSKIRFVVYKQLLESSHDKLKEAEYAYECAKAARSLDSNLASQYLKRAKQLSIDAKAKELLAMIEIGELALLTEKEHLNLFNVERILDRLPSTDRDTKILILSRILEKKTADSPDDVFTLIKETIISRSYHKDELLEVYVTNSTLNRFILQLFATIELNLNRRSDLAELRNLVSFIYSNQTVKKSAPIELVLDITKIVRNKFKSALDEIITKDPSTNTLNWNSKQNFEHVKQISIDLIHEILRCLHYVADSRNDVDQNKRASIHDEIIQIESLGDTLNLISFKKAKPLVEYTPPPNWYDMWLIWLGLKK